MRPEISDLVRQLTYPDLRDHNSVLNRPTLRGMQDSLVFVNHGHPEQELQSVMELRDQSSTSSKQNPFEAGFILKTVKYLAQQGYRSDQMVVLTPYLGQLNYLKLVLSKSGHDPVLNDLDSADLVQAGLMTSGAAKGIKKTLRIATIGKVVFGIIFTSLTQAANLDNYQGEEADVVLCSLTRSNSNHDIGFMSSPQRLNVLLSRARQALILIGNSDTFTQSKKGAALYQQFFQLMKPHVYDGLPTQCQQHPHHQILLSSESDFDLRCPEGGCHEPW